MDRAGHSLSHPGRRANSFAFRNSNLALRTARDDGLVERNQIASAPLRGDTLAPDPGFSGSGAIGRIPLLVRSELPGPVFNDTHTFARRWAIPSLGRSR